ncbi:MAG: hypothetical protein ACI8Q1_003263 [Parvicella sp.]|jgi:hypothetical protein
MKLFKILISMFLLLPFLAALCILAMPFFAVIRKAGLSSETQEYIDKVGLPFRDNFKSFISTTPSGE